nr:hypothetical protein [uncultured Anaerobutyricum sp.]
MVVKRYLFLFFTIGVLTLAIVSVIFKNEHNADISKKENTVITSEIEQFLKDRASIMISDEQTVSESPFISKKENLKEKELREQIAQFRDELKKSGETYSAIKTTVNFISSKKISDSVISIKIKEETYLTISNTDTATGYDAEHEIILKKHKNTWKIIEDKQLGPIGLLPLNEAKKYIEK